MTDHVLATVRRRNNGSHAATCTCGHTEVRPDRATATAMLYRHTIDAARDRSCPTPHKKGHGTQAEAEAALARFWRAQKPGARPTRVYLCRCRKWHTTKRPAPDQSGHAA
ncbi:hypothetical protein [Nocardia thailandica]|uniref:hypothetical protein n=1 Tax=Nocardia thailandica TaxID=257275 RepID=UPI0002F4101A|nr:hypothetical protein [Nocardia thailandica]